MSKFEEDGKWPSVAMDLAFGGGATGLAFERYQQHELADELRSSMDALINQHPELAHALSEIAGELSTGDKSELLLCLIVGLYGGGRLVKGAHDLIKQKYTGAEPLSLRMNNSRGDLFRGAVSGFAVGVPTAMLVGEFMENVNVTEQKDGQIMSLMQGMEPEVAQALTELLSQPFSPAEMLVLTFIVFSSAVLGYGRTVGAVGHIVGLAAEALPD